MDGAIQFLKAGIERFDRVIMVIAAKKEAEGKGTVKWVKGFCGGSHFL